MTKPEADVLVLGHLLHEQGGQRKTTQSDSARSVKQQIRANQEQERQRILDEINNR